MEPFEIHSRLKKFKAKSDVKMAEKTRAINTAENEFFSTWYEGFSEEMNAAMEDVADDIADDMMDLLKWNEDYPHSPVWDSELDEIEEEEEYQGPPIWDSVSEEGERETANLSDIEEPANQQGNAAADITEQRTEEISEGDEGRRQGSSEDDEGRRQGRVEFTSCLYPRNKLKWKNLTKCITGRRNEQD